MVGPTPEGGVEITQVPTELATNFHPINREQTGIVFSYTVEVDFNGKLYSFPLADEDFHSEEYINLETERPDIYRQPTVLNGHFTDINGEEPRVALPCDLKNKQATLDLYAGIKVRIVPEQNATASPSA